MSDRETDRALTEAGYMPLSEYIKKYGGPDKAHARSLGINGIGRVTLTVVK